MLDPSMTQEVAFSAVLQRDPLLDTCQITLHLGQVNRVATLFMRNILICTYTASACMPFADPISYVACMLQEYGELTLCSDQPYNLVVSILY